MRAGEGDGVLPQRGTTRSAGRRAGDGGTHSLRERTARRSVTRLGEAGEGRGCDVQSREELGRKQEQPASGAEADAFPP